MAREKRTIEKERERRECEHPPVSGGVYPAGTPTRPPPADVFIVLVQPRNSHSAATRNFAHYYYYYYYYSIEVPSPPPSFTPERKIFLVDLEVEGVSND